MFSVGRSRAPLVGAGEAWSQLTDGDVIDGRRQSFDFECGSGAVSCSCKSGDVVSGARNIQVCYLRETLRRLGRGR